MTKEEQWKREAERYVNGIPIFAEEGEGFSRTQMQRAYLAGAEPREKRIAELEKKISILLSCKNCPENKGGYICQKEYEDKCLAQKIQYIKELQEEIAELRTKTTALENANRAMIKELDEMASGGVSVLENVVRSKEQLTYAKTIIQDLLDNSDEYARQRAEDFLKENK